MGVQINGDTGNISATKADYSGNVTIGGTLTYEDVTNIDSVGLITARTGIEIGARPGVAASISVDGNMIVSGISTFGGDVQVPDKIIHSGDTNTAIRFPAADVVTVETGGSERFRVLASGGITVKNGDDQFSTTFEGGSSGSRNIVSVKAGNTTSGHNSGFRVTHSDGNAVLSMIVNHNDDNANIMNEHQGGALIFHTNESGSVAEKLRIDSSGRLLLGTTTEGHSNAENLTVSASGAAGITIRSTGNNCHLYFSDDTSGAGEYVGQITYNHTDDYMNFITDGSERMRISSDNEVLFGITATPSTTQNGIRIHTKPSDLPAFVVTSSASYTSAYDHYVFKNANGTVGSIRTSGGSTSFLTSSDYRLKENETAITDGITRLKQLKPYKFNFKSDPSTVLDGFFAHEVSSVVPDAVSGDKDCVATEQNVKSGLAENVGDIIPQRLDHSKLVPLLTAALQEAISEIETLKTEVAALKSQLNN